ncbi:MAG: hypothetical protein M2R45_00195 [Verrucomicrobia subdivision 3 bacterium]|nr:hypothetical protein [Limisphaerales bacterium]MCS1412346.1 hypothetical protein [Limisphaerales bacterium]
MKMHRDLDVTQQKTAWRMQQRICKAFAAQGTKVLFDGPVEVDETYFGDKERNKHAKDKLKAGHGSVSKTAVVSAKDRHTNKTAARVVESTDRATLPGFVAKHATEDTAYEGLSDHSAVTRSVDEYVSVHVHTNGVRVLLVNAQAGAQGHLPQTQFQSTCNATWTRPRASNDSRVT